MIDYDKTIDKFFTEVETYLTQRMERAKDKAEASEIQKTRFAWGMIKAASQKYINQKYDYVNMLPAAGFMRGDDNSIYHAVIDVLGAIRNLYDDYRRGDIYLAKQHQTEFENIYKRWKYKSSNSWLKDFTFPFRSSKSFLVRAAKEKDGK